MKESDKYYELIKIDKFSDQRGDLYCLESGKHLPFEFQRCFWISNVPTGQKRGSHAHRTCGELIIAAAGSFKVDVTDGTQSVTINLSSPDIALYIPPYTWCELYDFEEKALCLCLASQNYQVEGYINSFEEYQKIKKEE